MYRTPLARPRSYGINSWHAPGAPVTAQLNLVLRIWWTLTEIRPIFLVQLILNALTYLNYFMNN